MRVLLIHRYFWPDTPPYAQMLRRIAAALATEHEVTVFSTQPSYKPEVEITAQPRFERLDGFRVCRIGLLRERSRGSCVRVLNALMFAFRVFVHVLTRERYDAVMISTSPPVVAGLAAGLAARLRRTSFIYHCQDLHPEVALYSRRLQPGLVYRLLRRLDTGNCRRASKVVVLSEDMKTTLRERGIRVDGHVEIVNNFALGGGSGATVPAELAKRPGVFRIMFAGNIGRFQRLEYLIEIARLLPDDGRVEFMFLGDGAAKRQLMTHADAMLGSTVKFVGHVAIDMVGAALDTADLCVVSLSPDIYRVAYPSKTMSYLCAGKPLLVVVEENSELSHFVRTEAVGLVVSGESAAAAVSSIVELIDHPEQVRAMSRRARQLGQRLFTDSVVLLRWRQLFREVAEQRSNG
jgi:glycosyltransferase involved in cell wall biosynthesis